MLAWRITISAIVIPLLAGLFYLDARSGSHAIPLLLLVLPLAVRSVIELSAMIRSRIQRLQPGLLALGAAAIVVASWIPHWQNGTTHTLDLTLLALTFAGVFLLLCAVEAIRFRSPDGVLERLGVSTLIVTYCGLLLAITAQLRWEHGGAAGYIALGSLLVAVKGGDIGAYTFGRLFGRHKMAPALSPGKTMEGGLGAIVMAGVASWLWFTFAAPALLPGAGRGPLWAILLYGCILGVIGALGDLCESLFKRDVGVKDSGVLFPGFGGLLDLLDSVLYAGPIALIMWKLLPLTAL